MLYSAMRRKVTNLADGVTDDDIKELFESVGAVKFAAIEWDRRCAVQLYQAELESVLIPPALAKLWAYTAWSSFMETAI